MSQSAAQTSGNDGLLAFFVLACAITWLSDLPIATAFLHQTPPPAYALPLAGLGALGPTLAALLIAGRRRELGSVFGRWRTNPGWIALALFTPFLVNTLARIGALALGSPTSSWILLPPNPDQMIALVMFPIGEEFGWRGFAQPRMVARYGHVKGSLLLGLAWAIWHAAMVIEPATGLVNWTQVALMFLTLPLYSVLFTWMMGRGRGSMAIALAMHAGAHLDNMSFAAESDRLFRVLVVVVVGLAAALAGRSLSRNVQA